MRFLAPEHRYFRVFITTRGGLEESVCYQVTKSNLPKCVRHLSEGSELPTEPPWWLMAQVRGTNLPIYHHSLYFVVYRDYFDPSLSIKMDSDVDLV